MAATKVIHIKSTVRAALDYITDKNKTDGQLFVSSFGCTPEIADLEFAATRNLGEQNVQRGGETSAYHFIQSFAPGEIKDYTEAHRIGQEWAERFLKGNFEYVLTTHIDKGHIHNHLIFNAVNFTDYHRYYDTNRNYGRMRAISDQLCKEHGLSVITPNNNRGRKYKEWMEDRSGRSWKSKLRETIDKAVYSSKDVTNFLQKMQAAGYEIRRGKYLAFRAPGQKYFTNMKTLGNYYTDDKILERIGHARSQVKTYRASNRQIRLFIEMEPFLLNKDQAGFEYWAKLQNLKEASKTFCYLCDHNILNYEDFLRRESGLSQAISAAESAAISINGQLTGKRLIQKHCQNYRRGKSVVDKEKSEKNKAAYQQKFKAEYVLYESSKKALHQLQVTVLPASDRLNSEITELEKENRRCKKEVLKLKAEQKELETVKLNLQSYFSLPYMDKNMQR